MSLSDFDLRNQNSSVESRIVASLERISQAFRVLLWQESKEHSLTPIQVQVLIFISFHSPDKCKVSYLADEFNMAKATISETVKTLEQKQLIEKYSEPHDSRSQILRLTARGMEVAALTSMFSQEIRKPVDQLSAGDKENLLLSLLDIIRHLNRAGVITLQRMCLSCTYYEKTAGGGEHFCRLLNQKLHNSDLRIDCPEYESREH